MELLGALLDLVPLDSLPRTGWVRAGVPEPESVAAHGLGTALVALALAPRVDPPVDVDRTVALAVVHDTPEALLGDLCREGAHCLPPGAKEAAEARAAERLLRPLSPDAATRFAEFAAGETREARLALLCDRLHLGVRLLAYRRAGLAVHGDFVEGLAALDTSEFTPAAELRAALLRALEAPER